VKAEQKKERTSRGDGAGLPPVSGVEAGAGCWCTWRPSVGCAPFWNTWNEDAPYLFMDLESGLQEQFIIALAKYQGSVREEHVKQGREKPERSIIEQFLTHYKELTQTTWNNLDWCDENERQLKAVDCLAVGDCNGRLLHLAIEHTKLETYRNQIQDECWLGDFIQCLEARFREKWPTSYVSIAIPYEPGTKWKKEAAKHLWNWLAEHFDQMHETSDLSGVDVSITGFRSSVHIAKRKNENKGIFFTRAISDEARSDNLLDDRMRKALQHKREQLIQHKDEEKAIPVQILEYSDIALSSEGKWYASFFRVTIGSSSPCIGQVWLADTTESASKPRFLCFRADQALMDIANSRTLFWGPRHDEYWRKELGLAPA
jgi:hypothetical protein